MLAEPDGDKIKQEALDYMITPPRVLELMQDLLGEALELTGQAHQVATANHQEIDRFTSDTRIMQGIVEVAGHRIAAAIDKHRIEITGDAGLRASYLDSMRKAADSYERLANLADGSLYRHDRHDAG